MENINYVSNIIVNKENKLYKYNGKYYRMPVIDVLRKEARLVETDSKGNYLYDENEKTIKSDVDIDYFIDHAESIKL
ncbi:hypothetical protein ABE073_00395 [Lederbergia citrisecunda]|uniref:hypothetical protein n=1 Tax=Lederbergia citrisecunda TaxID=2833583 RepID=UPI003D2E0D06